MRICGTLLRWEAKPEVGFGARRLFGREFKLKAVRLVKERGGGLVDAGLNDWQRVTDALGFCNPMRRHSTLGMPVRQSRESSRSLRKR